MKIAALSGWTSEQKHVVAASFLGWALDAFDFFLLVFVLKDIAAEFPHRDRKRHVRDSADAGDAPCGRVHFRPRRRPLGAPADPDDQYPALLRTRICFGFSPNLTVLIVLRALYGIAMGGEWASEPR